MKMYHLRNYLENKDNYREFIVDLEKIALIRIIKKDDNYCVAMRLEGEDGCMVSMHDTENAARSELKDILYEMNDCAPSGKYSKMADNFTVEDCDDRVNEKDVMSALYDLKKLKDLLTK